MSPFPSQCDSLTVNASEYVVSHFDDITAFVRDKWHYHPDDFQRPWRDAANKVRANAKGEGRGMKAWSHLVPEEMHVR
jgi:hypothetical protein